MGVPAPFCKFLLSAQFCGDYVSFTLKLPIQTFTFCCAKATKILYFQLKNVRNLAKRVHTWARYIAGFGKSYSAIWLVILTEFSHLESLQLINHRVLLDLII